jgi:hypothetical protein
MQRIIRHVEREKTHTSIFCWSLGNECGYGAVHDEMAKWVRSRDSSRILHYEPATFGPRQGCEETGGDPKTGGLTSTQIHDLPPDKVIKAYNATDVLSPMYAKVSDCIIIIVIIVIILIITSITTIIITITITIITIIVIIIIIIIIIMPNHTMA